MLLLVLLPAFLACAFASGQRYAERNVLPAPSSPDDDDTVSSYDSYDYDYDGAEEGYGFREEEPDVYKWNVEKYPHPVNTPRFCNRLKPSHVCDPDLVLEREQADVLDDSIRELYRDTPCICETCKDDDGGIVVGIALLKYLHHPYHMHHAKVIRSFAENLRVRWKLGSCDNDILIVVATTDRLSYTDVGSATAAYLSIHEAHRIFLENKSKFSASNFSEGLADILGGYRRATKDMESKVAAGKGGDLDLAMLTGIIIGSVLLLGAVLFVGCVVYRRCRRSGKDVPDKDGSGCRAGATVSSSWSKKDIKVLFGPDRSTASSGAKYQKCGTEEEEEGNDPEEGSAAKGSDEIDFSLATPRDTSAKDQNDSETLERDLGTAAEGLVKTFPSNTGRSVLMTDM